MLTGSIKGPGNTLEGALEADAFSMKPHFHDEVHFEPLT